MFKNLLKSFRAAGPALPPREDATARARALVAEGNAAEDAGRLQDAVGLYRRALALAPALPAVHLNLGIAHEALGDAEAARACYRQVLALESGHPYGAYNLAKLDYVQGRYAEAEPLLRGCVGRKPDFAQAWVLLSNVLDARGDLQGAADANARALRLHPDSAGPLANQAGLLRALGRLDEALDAASRAAELEPTPDYLGMHAQVLSAAGFGAEGLQALQRALQLAPGRLDLRSRELFLLNLLEGCEGEDLAQRHRDWGAALEAAVPPLDPQPRGAAQRRLRLGFVSEDFRVHPVALFLLPLLEGRDRERFEICCYSLTRREDHVTRRIEALADRWVAAAGRTDAHVAQQVARDGIDVLVDLGGHTGQARLAIFAARPAPVQVSWVGYLNTTGLARMDFRLTDARCDPRQLSQPLHTETLLLLPQSQWCYRPFLDVEPAAAAACERNGFVTFGSFNSVTKLTDAAARRWGRILKALPTARLLVADVGSGRKREAILAAVAQEGADRAQVEFADRTDLEAYYRLMDRVDIALDSFPYGGGTTTFDALWMGVPVLTAPGATPASRSAASVLSLLDLDRWIAPSIADFEAVAIERAADTAEIARLRTSLRPRLRASPLMDEPAFVAAFETAMEHAWRQRTARRI